MFVFYLCLLSAAFVCAQPAADTVCSANLEKIFKALDLKIQYETVQYIYNEQHGRFSVNCTFLNGFFEEVKGVPFWAKKQSDSKSGKLVTVEWMTKEEMDRYLEQLNYPPSKAWKEYESVIQNIKSEKETYLQCIDAELAKDDSSGYAKKTVNYNFNSPFLSTLPPFLAKLDYLEVFKEFILNDNQRFLPDYTKGVVYLKCGCKIPVYSAER
jgi:hypothetical protein